MKLLDNNRSYVGLVLVLAHLFWALPVLGQILTTPGLAQRPHLRTGDFRLVSEDVTMVTYMEECRVRTIYVLRNDSEYAKFGKFGFPSSLSGDVVNFFVSMNGTPVSTHTREESELIIRDHGEYEFSEYIPVNWKLWEMEIPAEGTVEMVLEYSIPVSGQPDMINKELQRKIQSDVTYGRLPDSSVINDILHDLHAKMIGYVVLKENGWPPPEKGSRITIERQDALMRTVHNWEGKNISGNSKLAIEYVPGRSRFELASQAQGALRLHEQNPSLIELVEKYQEANVFEPKMTLKVRPNE